MSVDRFVLSCLGSLALSGSVACALNTGEGITGSPARGAPDAAAPAPGESPAAPNGAKDGGGAPSTGMAGGADASSDAAPSPSTPSTDAAAAGCGDLPVCDDFEGSQAGAPPNAATWAIVTPNCSGTGAVAVDATQAHSGTRSVKVTGAAGYCNHVFFATTAPAAIGKLVYGRFFVRMASALGDGHTTFLAMKDRVENKDLRMGGQSGILMWNRESDDATLPELSPAGQAKSVRPPAGQWQCVEFAVDGTTGGVRTWVDGRDVEGLLVDRTPTPDVDSQWLRKPGWAPTVIDAKFGWESYGGQANTLWFDDIALGARRIGCGS